MLPTPPNSISPTLRPEAAFNHQPHVASVDSDYDLRNAVANPNDGDQTHNIPPLTLDNTGEITPIMLAKYHLPDILLQQGPLAVRSIMGCLTASVPGFSRIPPAKARRLVVAALEGFGHVGGDNGGGMSGDVIFDKVGWGRWDAHRRDEPGHVGSTMNASPPYSNPSSYQQQGVQIPGASTRSRKNNNTDPYGPTSMTGDSAFFSHSEMDYGQEDVSMLEHEADKMSLDGDDDHDVTYSSSEAPDDEIRDEDWDEGDITDEEDWAQIGAAGLRARSLNAMGSYMNSHLGLQAGQQLHGGGPASSSLAKSAPPPIPLSQNNISLPDGVVEDREERAAIEALLRLGSM